MTNFEKIKQMTFERIKQMTVEEFAKMFGSSICQIVYDCHDNTIDCTTDCDDCIIDWLNQEVEEC